MEIILPLNVGTKVNHDNHGDGVVTGIDVPGFTLWTRNPDAVHLEPSWYLVKFENVELRCSGHGLNVNWRAK